MHHTARKRFGQNFLVDREIIDAIIAAIAPQGSDRMVEIGPGMGALTRPLLERLEHLHVVEIDRDIAARLIGEFPASRLTVHVTDALRFDFSALGENLRVVGNLPYNISSPLLFHLTRFASRIRDLHVMLQKEVVERMVAIPSTSAYGRLSVMLQYRYAMEKLLDVPNHAFRPVPRVESAVIRMLPRMPGELQAKDESLFARIVSSAFSQRRKTLRNTLGGYLTREEFAALSIDPGQRAQNLASGDFVRIANYLGNKVGR
ncbi:MAG TPA: 16S rRNA (adenine(1518)-N(6)/adenine(1519)-N(6))-dimethyltransferase RsmA [Burkholderiales bacterium]|nr:16S rRNA (adenine(1518)-N(6)/adenine(1519)-N(6))-dimethyltransferase RsmA [Burkholderiales bacterium]